MSAEFTGLAVALATPFTEAGDLDSEGLRRLVRHVIDGGADVLVPLGSTGEAATVAAEERDAIVGICLEEADNRPVVVGTGGNSTRLTAEATARAQELGAQAALIVVPYYNKPMPTGVVEHFASVAAAAPDLPLIAYNVPGRTGTNLTPPTLRRLWDNPQVVAVKESSGNLAQIGEIARTLPEGKRLLSGDDGLALASIAVGASGLVSVVANLLPAEVKALIDAARRGDLATAKRIHQQLLPLMDALFVESNPIPLKAALSLLGMAGDTVRLPLTRAEPETRSRLETALEQARGILP